MAILTHLCQVELIFVWHFCHLCYLCQSLPFRPTPTRSIDESEVWRVNFVAVQSTTGRIGLGANVPEIGGWIINVPQQLATLHVGVDPRIADFRAVVNGSQFAQLGSLINIEGEAANLCTFHAAQVFISVSRTRKNNM